MMKAARMKEKQFLFHSSFIIPLYQCFYPDYPVYPVSLLLSVS
jgi:hypothetical protein